MCRFHTVANWREDERRYARKQLIPGSGNFTNNFSTRGRHGTFFSGTMPAMSVIGGNADTT